MRPLPERMPPTAIRRVLRVPQQPYLRWDTNDYSIDPRFAGRRVEVRVGRREVAAIALDSGELCARHRRSFARHLTLTDPAHQAELDRLRTGGCAFSRLLPARLGARCRGFAPVPRRCRASADPSRETTRCRWARAHR